MPSDFDDAVNTSWLEALDITTGRIYFVHLESKDGELVRPTGKTSWDAPPGFLVRRELVGYLRSALNAVDDEAAFLAKVRDRFPPPPIPTTPEREVEQLRARVAQVEEACAELKARAEAAEANAQSQAGESQAPPTWKRGASSKWAGTVREPPPPPAWMLAKKTSSMGLYG